MTPALQTRGLTKRFGDFVANENVNLSIAVGARHALIGPNGAGKTTLINLLTGVHAPSAGDIFLDGERITELPQYRRVRRGMARTFQINNLFPGLSVAESVMLAVCERTGTANRWWRPVRSHTREADEVEALLATLGLEAERNRPTGALAYGQQRLVEIALALAARPRVLLLDEPAAGIPAAESRALFEVLGRLPREVTVLLIEHDMGLVFRFAERITVLVAGRILVEGDPEAIAADRAVREVYLGESA